MKRKDIEKILADEAERLDGKDSFEKISARISMPESRSRSGEAEVIAVTHHRRNAAIAAVAAVLILAIVAVTLGVVFGVPDVLDPAGITYISISINPALSMQVDENNKVTAVTALNADAQVLLLGMNLVGMDYNDACLAVMGQADREQYFEDGRNVNVNAVNDNTQREDEVRISLENTLNGYMDSHGYTNKVFVNYYSDEAIDAAGRYHISAGKAQLILDAEAVSDMSVEELYNMDYTRLLMLVMGSAADASDDFQRELDKRLEELEEEFERKTEELEEKVDEIEEIFEDEDDFENLSPSELARLKEKLISIVNDPDVGKYFAEIIPADGDELDALMQDMPAYAARIYDFIENLEDVLDDLDDEFEDRLDQIKAEYKRIYRS